MSKLVQHAHPEYRLSWVLNILQPCLEHFTAMLGTFYSHVWNILQPCLEHFTAMFIQVAYVQILSLNTVLMEYLQPIFMTRKLPDS